MEIILPEIVATGIYNLKIPSKNKMITNNRKTTMFEIEIPIESGSFSSQSYFSYAFKREMKIPPREYAKKVFRQYEQKDNRKSVPK